MQPSRTLSISIACSPAKVVSTVLDLTQLPNWAHGLCKAVRKQGEGWKVVTENGEFDLRFEAVPDAGVLDHVVILQPGHEVRVPMRVVRNEAGSELLFTLFRQPGMTDERFEQDAAMVQADLQRLKAMLEQG